MTAASAAELDGSMGDTQQQEVPATALPEPAGSAADRSLAAHAASIQTAFQVVEMAQLQVRAACARSSHRCNILSASNLV